MDKFSERRLAENEVFFREKNESIEKGFANIRQLTVEEGHRPFIPKDDDTLLHFYCECSDEHCRSRVQLKPSVYNQLHEKRDQFVVIPGHEVIEVERIILREPGYCVVQKILTPPPSATHLHSTDVDNV